MANDPAFVSRLASALEAQALDPSDALKISMILTLTRDELGDAPPAPSVG